MPGLKSNNNYLIKKIIDGNKPAFETLFKLYYPRLKKYAQYILHDNLIAEDLVQDVFVQIWNNRRTLNEELHFAPYIFTLTKNRCLNAIKRKVVEDKYVKKQTETEELYHISFEMKENFSSMEEKLAIELEKIIMKMPERCQVAFRLKWFEGKKIREIAEIMDISATMVDKHLAKGLQIARQNLNPEMFLFLLISRSNTVFHMDGDSDALSCSGGVTKQF